MKGIIFNLLEEVVADEYGEDTWDDVLARADVDGAFTSLGSYSDEQFTRLVEAAAAVLDRPANDVIRWFGTKAIPLLAAKYPAFFDKHQATRPFLLTVNGIIHPEVRKLYPGAETPDFEIDGTSPELLVMGYYSKRRLCALAEGFIAGAADHFDERAQVTHCTCMHRGDPHCRLEISFTKA